MSDRNYGGGQVLRERAEAAEARVAKLEAENEKMQHACDAAVKLALDRARDREKAEAEVEKLRERVKAAEAGNDALRRELSACTRLKVRFLEDFEAAEAEVEKLRSELPEREALREELLPQAMAEVESLRGELELCRTLLANRVIQCEAAEAKLAEVEKNVDKWRDRALPVEHRLAEVEGQRGELLEERDHVRTLTDEAKSAEAKLAEARHQLSLEEQQHKDENDRLRSKLAEVEERLDWFLEIEKKMPTLASIERVRDLAEAFLADVQSSLGPDPHAFDNPETCAKDALALVREIARLLGGRDEPE